MKEKLTRLATCHKIHFVNAAKTMSLDVYVIVLEIKEAQYIKRINMQLRAENKVMKKQIEDLKAQLSQLKGPAK